MIDRATIDRIMDAVDIVDVVSDFVTLRKAGVNYKGLCPFHDDKTPSFMVSPSKGICHCFACGEGGNAVNFIMKHEQMTYPEALRWLAKKYNIEIKERELSDAEKQEQDDRESMFILNEWAKGYFHDTLLNNVDGKAIGLQYFRSRGIRDDIIEKFQLGFALSPRDSLSKAAIAKGYKEDYLVKTGLCYKRDDGSLVDRYAGRVIFPWFNVSGRINAFGGRLLDSRTKGVQQKYVNSPESDIYHKDHELYGLFQAKRAIAKEDCVYMVEGYTDVIAMHQSGIENVVANSGTALSYYQIRLLHRFTQNIVLLYDGDEAGIHAAMRGTDMLLSEGMNIKVLTLPDGDDPDSFSRKHSAEELRRYIDENKKDFIEFKTAQLLLGVTDPIKRSEAISSIVKSISVIPDQITRDTYIHECAHSIGIAEQTLINTMNKFIRGEKEEKIKEEERERRRQENSPSPTLPQGEGEASAPDSKTNQSALPLGEGWGEAEGRVGAVELLLIQFLVKNGEKIIYDDVETDDGSKISLNVAQFVDYDLAADDLHFSNETYNKILSELLAHSADADFKATPFLTMHSDPDIARIASSLAAERYQLSRSLIKEEKMEDLRQQANHLILDFRKDYINQHLNAAKLELRQVGSDMTRAMEIMKQIKDLEKLRNELAKKVGNDIIV